MTTLIAVYNSEGCVGRCDAKRYDAEWAPCDCICQGRNHGAGKQQAIDNTRELARAGSSTPAPTGDIALAELAIDAQHEPLFSLAGGGNDD